MGSNKNGSRAVFGGLRFRFKALVECGSVGAIIWEAGCQPIKLYLAFTRAMSIIALRLSFIWGAASRVKSIIRPQGENQNRWFVLI